LKIAQVELPTEVRKRDFRKQLGDTEHYLAQDVRIQRLFFEIKHMQRGSQRRQPSTFFGKGFAAAIMLVTWTL
jgi:hypothetical protein